MADYYPLIARAIDGLSDGSPAMRSSIYERARTALIEQLRSLAPPPAEADIERERVAPDAAIARVEAERAPAPPPPSSSPPPPAYTPAAPAPAYAPPPPAPAFAPPP